MNRSKLKNYAPQARREFIQAMTDRAAFYGLTAKTMEPIAERGDVALIAGREHPRAVAKRRRQLENRIKRHGFEQTMEALAYTWFNRLVAIRFMELHGYLGHGYRVLSHPEGKATPEILEHAVHVELPGLKQEVVLSLKLAGNKEAELYRLLLIAQCNALNAVMPFLFEKIDDETELLLPDNLLHSDSLIRKLVSESDEDDWRNVEIIGWLYQFYISERKEQVIGKVVGSEDIPAATQLFTPNWIVKYLVQNTLGRQWLATYPQSALRRLMPYYIEPAAQTADVQDQLKANTPASLNPEEITLLDPACGSGHILIEAYDLFKAIYQERGYQAQDIPSVILQRNLFGLEIDDRAAQLSAFALTMKARADDRRICDREVKPNILAFTDSVGLSAADITHALNSPINKEIVPSEYLIDEIEEEKAGLFSKKRLAEEGQVSKTAIVSLLALFENAKTFGSLIQIPSKLAAALPEIERRLDDVLKHGNLTQAPAHVLKPLLLQARVLLGRYSTVVANPPYMGSGYFTAVLKTFVNEWYKNAKGDLYSCFIHRSVSLAQSNGLVGLITIPNWMFLSSFESFRKSLLVNQSIDTFVHNGRGVFGADFGSCAFTLRTHGIAAYRGTFRKLFEKQGSVASNEVLEERFRTAANYTASSSSLATIPGSPIAYWVSEAVRNAFESMPALGEIIETRKGMATGNNRRFVRCWYEVSRSNIGIGLDRQEAQKAEVKWFPFANGGGLRKWYGNHLNVVNWRHDGAEIQTTFTEDGSRVRAVNLNLAHIFSEGITWTSISSSFFGVRSLPAGFLFSSGSNSAFIKGGCVGPVMGFLNSVITTYLLRFASPTINANPGDTEHLPFDSDSPTTEKVSLNAEVLMQLARVDWDTFEVSWDFQRLPILQHKASRVQQSQMAADAECVSRLRSMKALEEENNRLFIDAYKLQGELSPEVPDDQVTLYRPDRGADVNRLFCFAIGCMMGRYSLDKPGLIYANTGNQGFDSSQYQTFRADDDGIVPLLKTEWGFRDDVANRIVEFIGVVWPKEHLEENLRFIAESLDSSSGDNPRDTIRRYLATGFFKDHLSTYKRRPIYWLFSSGKQRVFQCLVYLHRYHEGTLARMRTEYVIPFQGQIAARIERLEGDEAKATSTSLRRKLRSEQDDLKNQQVELHVFEEKLKHAADQKVSLDLDDGVRVNYGKFGDLLAEVKTVTGEKDDE